MASKVIYIKGMHCVSCEKLLDEEFQKIEGVRKVKVDCKKNTARIDYNGNLNFSEVKKVAQKFGYDAFENEEEMNSGSLKATPSEWIISILVVGAMFIVYRIFQNLGVVDRIDLQGSDVTLGIALLVGLVASLSSCLAVVGGVVIAFGEKYRSDGDGMYEKAVKPNLLFHAGRLGTFFVLGGILGLIGVKLNISGNFISIFTIMVALVMAWLGLNILGIIPSISKMGIRMPGKFTSRWNSLKESEHKAAPLMLGALSFFLPCGFTQSMQIFALASGSFLVGGLTLLAFALGTLPVLLVLGITTSWARSKRLVVFEKVAGFLVVIFAIFTLQTGLALQGVDTAVLSTGNNDKQETVKETKKTKSNQKEQVIEMKITRRGFEPSVFTIKKGVPVKWVIEGEQVTGCSNRIIVPDLDIAQDIKFGENIIRFTPEDEGSIPFSCWMGMIRGKFFVE